MFGGMLMNNFLWIILGGTIGTGARFGFSGLIARLFGETFPWGTIIVNVTGCFAIGFFFTATGTEGRWLLSPVLRQFFMIGVCGGYTTFSSFGLQTFTLVEDGQWFKAAANVLVSVICCLVAIWLGHFMATNFDSTKGS